VKVGYLYDERRFLPVLKTFNKVFAVRFADNHAKRTLREHGASPMKTDDLSVQDFLPACRRGRDFAATMLHPGRWFSP
jgi:hypothetical protein